MTYRIRMRQVALTGVAAIALAATSAAYAQQQQAAEIEEVVVTGTLIRGIAPVGSSVISIGRTDIESSVAPDLNKLMSELMPQSNFFMENLEPGRGGQAGIQAVPVLRPQLRSLGDEFQGSGAPTLVLLDGGRIVPVGISQSVVDAGSIPSGILERQETILDGASAVYGSDAVAGVINYISRKRVDRTEANVTYGFADNYYSIGSNLTSGVKWDTGGFTATYSFSKSKPPRQGDRPEFATRDLTDTRFNGSTTCDTYTHGTVGTGTALRRFVITPTGTTGATLVEGTNYCLFGKASQGSGQERHSGFAVLSQDISDTIKLDINAFFTWRMTESNGPFTGSFTSRSTNPYYRAFPGVAGTPNQTINIDFSPVLGDQGQYSRTFSKIGQVTPTITIDLPGEWQVRSNFAWGKSRQAIDLAQFDTVLLNEYSLATTRTTTFNPYNLLASDNLALYDRLWYNNIRIGIHQLLQVRALADGPVFSLPGGKVHAAFGAEWNKTSLRRQYTNATTHLRGPWSVTSAVTNKAVFGEVVAPLVGPDNKLPFVESLTLSVSGRYDSYGGGVDTFNPKFAMTYEPVDWIAFRGSWGTSFRAPNAADKVGAEDNNIRCQNIVSAGAPCEGNGNVDVPVGVTPAPGGANYVYMFVQGTVPNLKPETSKNWSIGTTIRPPWVPNLNVELSYYSIDYKDLVSFPPTTLTGAANTAPFTLTYNPTAAQLDAFAALSPDGSGVTTLSAIRNAGLIVGLLYDGRRINLARRTASGLDASVRYTWRFGWGSIDANVNGNWRIKEQTQAQPTLPVTGSLATGTSRFRATLGLGTTIGDFRAQASVQHRSGYRVDPSATRYPGQTTIDQVDFLNLSFRYNFRSTTGPLLEGVSVNLNISNALNTAPAVNRTTSATGGSQGFTNGSTLGRIWQFGLSKRF